MAGWQGANTGAVAHNRLGQSVAHITLAKLLDRLEGSANEEAGTGFEVAQ